MFCTDFFILFGNFLDEVISGRFYKNRRLTSSEVLEKLKGNVMEKSFGHCEKEIVEKFLECKICFKIFLISFLNFFTLSLNFLSFISYYT